MFSRSLCLIALLLAGLPAVTMGQDSQFLLAELNASTFELETSDADYHLAKQQTAPLAIAREQAEAKLDAICVDKEKQIDALIAKANQPCPQMQYCMPCGGGCGGGGGGGGGFLGGLLQTGLMMAANYYTGGAAGMVLNNSNTNVGIFGGGGGGGGRPFSVGFNSGGIHRGGGGGFGRGR